MQPRRRPHQPFTAKTKDKLQISFWHAAPSRLFSAVSHTHTHAFKTHKENDRLGAPHPTYLAAEPPDTVHSTTGASLSLSTVTCSQSIHLLCLGVRELQEMLPTTQAVHSRTSIPQAPQTEVTASSTTALGSSRICKHTWRWEKLHLIQHEGFLILSVGRYIFPRP